LYLSTFQATRSFYVEHSGSASFKGVRLTNALVTAFCVDTMCALHSVSKVIQGELHTKSEPRTLASALSRLRFEAESGGLAASLLHEGSRSLPFPSEWSRFIPSIPAYYDHGTAPSSSEKYDLCSIARGPDLQRGTRVSLADQVRDIKEDRTPMHGYSGV